MDEQKRRLTEAKYRLPYHWMRDPLTRDSLPYFGYAQIAIDHLPQPPAKVLDAGCGDGRITKELVARGYDVTGVEIISHLAQYASGLVPEARFFNCDLREDLTAATNLESSSFDAVIIVEVYEHVPPADCHLILANAVSMLRPGGTAIVTVPSKQLPPSNLHYRHFDAPEIVEEVESAGLQVDDVIRQHRLDAVTGFVLGNRMEKWLNNSVIQLPFLKKVRKKWYMTWANRVKRGPCGRYIVVARKPAVAIDHPAPDAAAA